MSSHTRTCSKCHQEKVHIQFDNDAFGEPLYADHLGRRWYWRVCPDCRAARVNAYHASLSTFCVDNSTIPTVVKGRKAERTVERHLKFLGYTEIQLTRFRGPDIKCKSPDGVSLTIEVKSTSRSGAYWCVGRVSQPRRSDDLIAIVLPNEKVLMEPMREHLSKCHGSGSTRCITLLVREHCPEEFATHSKRSPRSNIGKTHWDGFSYSERKRSA